MHASFTYISSHTYGYTTLDLQHYNTFCQKNKKEGKIIAQNRIYKNKIWMKLQGTTFVEASSEATALRPPARCLLTPIKVVHRKWHSRRLTIPTTSRTIHLPSIIFIISILNRTTK